MKGSRPDKGVAALKPSQKLPAVEPGGDENVVAAVEPGREDNVVAAVEPGREDNVVAAVEPGRDDNAVAGVEAGHQDDRMAAIETGHQDDRMAAIETGHKDDGAAAFARCDDDGDWPDFQYWMSLPFWNIEEATALSFGSPPKIWKRLPDLSRGVREDYEKRLTHFERAVDAGELSAKLRPPEVIRWLQGKGYAVPQRMECAPSKRLVRQSDELGTLERKTLLRMVLGMAMHKYRLDLDKEKQGAAGSIAGALYELGISVSDDTVRKKLEKAVEEVGTTLTTRKWPPP